MISSSGNDAYYWFLGVKEYLPYPGLSGEGGRVFRGKQDKCAMQQEGRGWL